MKKNTILVGSGMLTMAVVIGLWIIKFYAPVPVAIAPTAQATSSERSSPSPALSASNESRQMRLRTKRGLRAESAKAAKIQTTKMEEELSKQLTDRQREKFEKYFLTISENVNLTASQKADLTAWMHARLEKFDELDFTNAESLTIIPEMMGSISEKAMSDELMALLTDEQKEAFKTFKEQEFQGKVLASVVRSHVQLKSVVDIEEGQLDELYKIFTAAAGERIPREQEQTDYTSKFTEGMGIDMDQRIEQKVEQLRPVLNVQQLEQFAESRRK